MWYINGRVESLPLTDMRNINGWVESLVLRRNAGGLFLYGENYMKKTEFYIIKDKFFEDMTDPYLKGNKAGKPCDVIHIVKLDDSRESAFLI